MKKKPEDGDDIYRKMIDSLYEGIYFVDKERKINYWSKGAERISGYKKEEVTGFHCYDNILNHVNDKGELMCKRGCPLEKTIADGQRREGGFYLLHKDGHRVPVAVKTIPFYENGRIAGGIEVFIDDKDLAETNKEIDKLKTYALYDQLTELPNRRYIDSFMDNRLREWQEFGIPFGVIMFDIDNFKKFNDTYGHDTGDLVLKEVAKTLMNSFRKNDMIGRWGGEEFLAVLTGVDQADVGKISDKARSLVEKSVLKTKDGLLSVTVSAGAAISKENDTGISVIKRADAALYESKKGGRNRVTFK